MTDLQTLALVLFFIYGWECACWFHRGTVVFSTRWGRRWKCATPGTLLGNHRGGFLPAHPLPPLGHILATSQQALSFSPTGILAFVPPPINPDWRVAQSGTFIPFQEITSIHTRGKTIFVNNHPLITTGSAPGAQSLARQLRQLRKLPQDQRHQAIQNLFSNRLSLKPAQQRWNEFQKSTPRIRLLCNLLFAYVFVAIPLLIHGFGIQRSWIAILAGLLCFTVSIALQSHRVHQQLYPEAEDDRFTLFITLLLSPPTTIRACDALSRPLLSDFDPLVAARLFLKPEQSNALARDLWLSLQYPLLPVWTDTQKEHQSTELSSRQLFQQTLTQSLTENGISVANLTAPPAPLDNSILTYCPRCRNQYILPSGPCPDCQNNIALLPITKAGIPPAPPLPSPPLK